MLGRFSPGIRGFVVQATLSALVALALHGCSSDDSGSVAADDIASSTTADTTEGEEDSTALDDSGMPPSDASQDAEGDAGDDAEGDVEPDVAEGPTGCPTRIDWAQGEAFPQPRDHHVTFVAGTPPSLYVVGGYQQLTGLFSNAWRAPLGDDGSLGSWVDAGGLAAKRSGMAMAQSGERVYLLGGHNGAGHVATTLSFTVDSDGNLSGERAEADLPSTRFHMAAVATDAVIYATGGLAPGGAAGDTVWTAALGTDGVVTEWQAAGTLPEPRSHHSSLLHDGWLYVAGGFEGNPVGNLTTYHPNILRASVDGTTVGTWEDVGVTLPAGGISTQAAAGLGECMLLGGGITDSPLAVSDGVMAFDTAALALTVPTGAMPAARSHVHQSPVYAGLIYYVSGKDTFSSNTGSVAIGKPRYE